MTFTKNKGLFLVIVAIVLGFFNGIAFVLPFARLGGFWTGYAFATLAILLTAFVLLYAFGHEGMKSKFYGVPLTFIVWPYLIVQVILSILEMAIPGIPYKYEVLLNCVPLAIALIGLIGVNAGKEEIERLDAKVKGKVFYIKSLQGDVESFASRTQDADLQKSLKALVETIRYSDPMSAPQLATVENAIEAKVASLGESLGGDVDAAKSICDELQQLFADRNRKCKLLK